MNWSILFAISKCILRINNRGGKKHRNYKDHKFLDGKKRWSNGDFGGLLCCGRAEKVFASEGLATAVKAAFHALESYIQSKAKLKHTENFLRGSSVLRKKFYSRSLSPSTQRQVHQTFRRKIVTGSARHGNTSI